MIAKESIAALRRWVGSLVVTRQEERWYNLIRLASEPERATSERGRVEALEAFGG